MSVNRAIVNVGVIGCGHWGPNHVRVFSEQDRSQVVACADLKEAHLDRIKQRFPSVSTTSDYKEILADDRIDAVIIATPTKTHAAIAREAILAGKHVLVEKPLCPSAIEAEALGRLADAHERVLMVGHVFVFNAGIIELRNRILANELGKIHYFDAVRTNLGPIRGDVNALYDLGTHDITIFNYIMNEEPVAVSATGRCITQADIEDVCFATLHYADGTLGHIHVSWLNPRKVRTLTVIGDKKMAHWDDVDPNDMLRLYDKGVQEPPYYDSFGEFNYLLRNADVQLPAIHRTEPLIGQATAFLNWITSGQQQGPGAKEGAAVARVLEAATQSMANGGVKCPIPHPLGYAGPIVSAPMDVVAARTWVRGTEADMTTCTTMPAPTHYVSE